MKKVILPKKKEMIMICKQEALSPVGDLQRGPDPK